MRGVEIITGGSQWFGEPFNFVSSGVIPLRCIPFAFLCGDAFVISDLNATTLKQDMEHIYLMYGIEPAL